MPDRPDEPLEPREPETTTEEPSEDELERRSLEALAESSGADLPSSGLLSFYDRLRERVIEAVEKRGGRMGEGTVRALLLVPDVFILLVRLALDREVPASARMLIGGALAYFVLPMDLLPEALVGVGGFVDDLVIATAVLAQAFGGELEPYARKHWSGSEDLRVVIRDVGYAAENLLGTKLYGRLEALLARRGIRLPESGEAPRSEPSSS
ncbi:MAG: YkvA family protein [Thermoanaerobaculia bacterium]